MGGCLSFCVAWRMDRSRLTSSRGDVLCVWRGGGYRRWEQGERMVAGFVYWRWGMCVVWAFCLKEGACCRVLEALVLLDVGCYEGVQQVRKGEMGCWWWSFVEAEQGGMVQQWWACGC